MEKLTTMDIYELCNKNRWFTCGTNSAYEKMFEFVREANIHNLIIDYDIDTLARMIWMNSDEEITFKEVRKAIRQRLAEKLDLYLYE